MTQIGLCGAIVFGLAALAVSAQQVSLVRQIDHVLFRTATGAEGRKLVALLSETLGLPVVFPPPGDSWTASSGLGFGNCILEIFHFNRNETVDPGITSLALEPATNLDAAVGELRARKIDHFPPARYPEAAGAPLRWTIVGLRGLGHGMFLIQYNLDMEERRNRYARALRENKGGALGVVRMREVTIGHRSRAQRRQQWTAILGPPLAGEADVWRLGAGPQIRLVDTDDARASRFLLEVQSLATAAAALSRLGIKFQSVDGLLKIDPGSLFGLRLVLMERQRP